MKQLRSIHVGVGTRGKVHVQAALDSEYWRPVALVDTMPNYLATAAALTGLPETARFSRLEDALAAVESDAVIVASPVSFHAQQILAALQANRHVLTEKAFALSVADAQRCVAEAEARDRKLMVVQNMRLTRTARTLRRLVAEETYGPLGLFLLSYFKPRIVPYNRNPHMQLWEQSVHELDTVLAVVQRPLQRVMGLSTNPVWCDWPTESTVQVIAEFTGNVSGTYISTSNARSSGYEFRLECAEATIIAHDMKDREPLRVVWGPRQQHEEQVPLDMLDLRGLESHPAAATMRGQEPLNVAMLMGFLDLQIYRDFAEYILNGQEPESSGRRNLETMRFVEAVQTSTDHHAVVMLA